MEKRTVDTHMFQTPDERRELEALAETLGMSMSSTLRYAVKRLAMAEGQR